MTIKYFLHTAVILKIMKNPMTLTMYINHHFILFSFYFFSVPLRALVLPDTVTLKEMKQNYYENLHEFERPSIMEYDYFLDYYKKKKYIRESILAMSPDTKDLAQNYICALEEKKLFDSVIYHPSLERNIEYSSHHAPIELYLTKIQKRGLDSPNEDALIKILAEKYGNEPKDKRPYRIKCSWLTGNLTLFRDPILYFGVYLSRMKINYHVEKGVVTRYTPYENYLSLGVLDSIANRSFKGYSMFEPWGVSQSWEMKVWADTLNRMLGTPNGKGCKKRYIFLIHMDRNGTSNLHCLTSIDGRVGGEVDRLKRAVTRLPRNAVTILWTLDGRAFPGRYIKAEYTPQKGWILIDYHEYSLNWINRLIDQDNRIREREKERMQKRR